MAGSRSVGCDFAQPLAHAGRHTLEVTTTRTDDGRRPRWALLAAGLVTLGLLACGLVVVDATRSITVASRQQSVLGTLESRFAVSHTWLEELAGGDGGINARRDILTAQTQAGRLCRRLRERTAALDDSPLDDRVGSLCRGIAQFRSLTVRRLSEPRVSLTDPSGRHSDDVIFASVLVDADAIRGRMELLADNQRTRRGRALGVAAALLLTALLGAAVLALRARRARPGPELEELRTIKLALVPTEIPERPGLELATCHVAAEAGVAGDFHLVVRGPRDTTAIFIGDVAGKGILAARRAAYLRASLAAFAPYEDSPRRLLELANRALMHAAGVSEHFVTLACVVVDPSAGSLTWASAGHPPPIELDTGRPLETAPTLPLGLTHDLRLEERQLEVHEGDGLLLYTDGLSEARTDELGTPDLLGAKRIGRVVREHAGAGLDELAGALRHVAEQHSGGRLADDLCLVALRVDRVCAPVS